MNRSVASDSVNEGHIFRRYDKELSALIKLVLDMGKLAQSQINDAGKAIKSGDINRAHRILENEETLDNIDVQAEHEIQRILALRQPMAKDLRFILTINRLVSYLERIGDQSKSIAELCIKLYGQSEKSTHTDKLASGIPRMANYVQTMVSMSMKAFEDADMELALEVLEMEQELNDQFDSSIRSITTFVMQDSKHVGQAVDVVLGYRCLDRIGGHAKSIARQIIFMVKGTNVRHKNKEVLTTEVRSAR